MSVILATWKIEVTGLQFEAIPGTSLRPYLKNKLKRKSVGGGWLSGRALS
jgi:hypothetical protein